MHDLETGAAAWYAQTANKSRSIRTAAAPLRQPPGSGSPGFMNRRDTIKLLLATSGGILAPAALSSVLAPRVSGARSAEIEGSLLRLGGNSSADGREPAFQWLPIGQVKPGGWIREQMLRDLHQGFAGHLGELCHEASSDIFASHRNHAGSANQANVENNEWWNGETEGNWRNGQIMMAYLTEDKQTIEKVDEYVAHILSFQDQDGYLGVFAPEVRFSKPGELWTQTCLMRGLLAYSDLAGKKEVLAAVRRAIDLTISSYESRNTPIPFDPTISGQGLSHDLMISDVMERLFEMTSEPRYRDFTVGLYEKLSRYTPGADTSLNSLLDPQRPFVNHGANTFEAIRVPLWLWFATGRQDLKRASMNALEKLSRYTELSGSDVSEEWIKDLKPDPSTTEYEYCGTKEMQFTLQSALQKTGEASLGDKIETIWFNAAQGSRLPDGSAVSYLTSDNRLHCDGLSADGRQPEIRNKFSPTHADVAVCCNPNATQVAPLFVRGMWMRHSQRGLAALLYGPCSVSTVVDGVPVRIEERTNYPFDHEVEFEIRPDRELAFPLYLRDPSWSGATRVRCNGASIQHQGSYWVVQKSWQKGDRLRMTFAPVVRQVRATNGEVALQYGPLLFAQAIDARKVTLRVYPLPGFEDAHYEPAAGNREALTLPSSLKSHSYGFTPRPVPRGANPLRPFDAPVITLAGTMKRQSDGTAVPVTLVPLGNAAILRRVTFPIG